MKIARLSALSMLPDSSKSIRPNARIEYLDALRGVAVTMVVLYHACKALTMFGSKYGYTREWIVSRYGLMGVELFFMISGFVILMTLEKCKSVRQFFWKRWIRLFPAMLVATLLTLTIVNLSPEPWWDNKDSLSVIPGLSFIDDRWLSVAFGETLRPLDGAYWTIFVEVRFYILFGTLYFLFNAEIAIVALAGIAIVYLISLTTGKYFGNLEYSDFHFAGWFAAGALFYRFRQKPTKARLGIAIACGLLAAWSFFPSHGPRIFGALLVLLLSVCVTSASTQKLLSNPLLLWLGGISYPLYLVHTRVIEATYRIIHHYTSNVVLMLAIPIALAMFIGWLIAKWAEPWVRITIEKILMPERVRSSQLDFSGQPPL